MKAKKMSQRINMPVIARKVKMESLDRLAKKKNQTKKKVVLVKIMRKTVKMNLKEKMKMMMRKKKERKKVKNQMRKMFRLRKNKK